MYRIIPGLYVGNKEVASDASKLSEYQIRKVISLGCTVPHHEPVEYLGISSLLDTPEALILNILPETTDFIATALKDGVNVLVHCVYGQSRSCTVIVAYLLSLGHSLESSIALVTKNNPSICINPGFLAQLYFLSSSPCIEASLELALLRSTWSSDPSQSTGSKRKLASTSLDCTEIGAGTLVCRSCRHPLTSLDAVLTQSLDPSAVVKQHVDGFWRGYQPARSKALGPLTRLPIKGSWAVYPSEWMVEQSHPPLTVPETSARSGDSSGAVMNASVDIDKETTRSRVVETKLLCLGCGAEVGDFAPRQLDLIGIYNPCDLYTLSEVAVRRVKHRVIPTAS